MKKKELKSSEKRNGCLFLLIIFIGFVMYIYFSTPTPKSESEMTRTELIERQFSAWDGSHPALERLIKKSCIQETPNLSTNADSSTKIFFRWG